MTFLRRISRFSLRSFFATLLSLSLVVGFVGMQVGASQREAAVVAKLANSVGPVTEVGKLLLTTS